MSNKIGNEGTTWFFTALTHLKKLNSLELYLGSNGVGIEGVKSLSSALI